MVESIDLNPSETMIFGDSVIKSFNRQNYYTQKGSAGGDRELDPLLPVVVFPSKIWKHSIQNFSPLCVTSRVTSSH